MKEIQEILNQEPVYLNDWSEDKIIGVISDFEGIHMTKEAYESNECPWPNNDYYHKEKSRLEEAIARYKDINILFASYTYEDYSGDAWVLFEKDGKLFEVNGSHCSCYGLEGQWEPEEANLLELQKRFTKGSNYYSRGFSDEIKEFLGI